jgi:hypothetical protein
MKKGAAFAAPFISTGVRQLTSLKLPSPALPVNDLEAGTALQ